jgi:endo-1,4-beta-xylanase
MKTRANPTRIISSAIVTALGFALASEGTTLRSLAEARGLPIGAAVAADALFGPQEPEYAKTLAREFNMMTAENAMKWGALRPSREQFIFNVPDLMIKFAENHGITVRGHNLIWHQSNPAWLIRGNFKPGEMSTIMHDHIKTVVEHFKGKLAAWDVVNEAVSDQTVGAKAKMRDTIWSKTGPDYIGQAFKWARESDPDVKLFYNDYNAEGMNPKSQTVYELVRDLKSKGVPIDGVGLQMHVGIKNPPSMTGIAANMKRLNDLGLEVQVTEMDVKLDTNQPLAQQLQAQAKVYADVLRVCLAASRCTAFVLWGFTDGYSWLASSKPLLFDGVYKPKPAYDAMKRVLGEQPK